MKAWSSDIREAVEDCAQRPRTLLALLNPYGGSGRARGVWEREAFPLLAQAGAQKGLPHLSRSARQSSLLRLSWRKRVHCSKWACWLVRVHSLA